MKNTFLILFIIIVVLALVAFLFGALSQEQQRVSRETQTQQPPSPPPVTLPSVLYNVSGAVRSVAENSFVMEAKIPEVQNNSIVHQLQTKTVHITTNTRITRLRLMSQEDGTKKPEESAISFSALQRGDQVEVVSGQEVREEVEIQATQVRVLPSG